MQNSEWQVENVPLAVLVPDPENPRTHDDRNLEAIRRSLAEHGQVEPIVVQRSTMMVVGGNGRLQAMGALGWDAARCVLLDLDDAQARRLSISLNRTGELAGWDVGILASHLKALEELAADEWDAGDLGFETTDLDALIAELDPDPAPPPHRYNDGRSGALVDDFGAPPFTVLDTRQGYWQDRKRWWVHDVGLLAAKGRENLGDTNSSQSLQEAAGGSRGAALGGSAFDPVLAELACQWFCPTGGTVLDPFAGEAVKGVVAAARGYQYTGIEIRQEQVDANLAQWQECQTRAGWTGTTAPQWVCGDSQQLDALLPPGKLYDFSFTSPPYYDLEVYSSQDGDGSAIGTYGEFMQWYRRIFKAVVARLRPGAFLVVKVGDVRDRKSGAYHGFVPDNISMFQDLGLHFYNDAVLLTPAGTAPLRAGLFASTRKMVRVHQNVLVFWKGDPRRVQAVLGELERGVATVPVKVSVASANLLFQGCELQYIKNTCLGRCCTAPSSTRGVVVPVLPERVEAVREAGGQVVDGWLTPHAPGRCDFLGDDGLCQVHGTLAKPTACTLSPFTLNANDTLVIKNRNKMLTCYRDRAVAQTPAWKAYRSSLVALLGKEVTETVVEHLAAGGGDIVVQVAAGHHRKIRWILDRQREEVRGSDD